MWCRQPEASKPKPAQPTPGATDHGSARRRPAIAGSAKECSQAGQDDSVIVVTTTLVASRATAKVGADQSVLAGRRPAIVAHGGLLGHIALGNVPQNRGWITLRRRSIAPGTRQAETQDVAALDLTRLL